MLVCLYVNQNTRSLYFDQGYHLFSESVIMFKTPSSCQCHNHFTTLIRSEYYTKDIQQYDQLPGV